MPLTVAQLVARLTADTSNFYRGMAVANSAMLQSGSIISRVAAGAGLATLGMGIMSLRAAGNYQQSMNILEAVSGATTKQMAALSKQAIALGADIKLPNVSAKDAAESMTELAKGGLSVKNVMGATRGTLQLGIAANISFADSANVVARALTAFHLAGSKATTVADLFTAAANRSTADIGDIALGFQAASAQFQAGDQTIQGLTTSLTLMANAGIVGSDAGTSLKTMMNRLMAPTKKAKDLMGELGISIYDSAGNMRPMPALIGQFNRGMRGMTKEQKNAALYTIFGSDAIRAARVQMNAGTDGWLKMEKAITKGGEAQKFAEARTKGFNGAIQALGSQIETLAINLGTAMLPAATKVARALSNFVASVDPQKIIGFFSAIKDGVQWFINLTEHSKLLQAILIGLAGGLGAYVVLVQTVAAVTKVWAIAQGILNAVMDANPIILIIAALVALAAGLYYAYQRSETFREIVQKAFGAVLAASDWVVMAGKKVVGAMQQMYSAVKPILSAMGSQFSSVFGLIRSITNFVWPIISAIVSAAVKLMSTVVRSNLNVIGTIIRSVWNVISTITRSVWNVVKSIVTNVLDVIHGKISATTAFKNIISAVWTAFNAITKSLLTAWRDIVTSAINAVWTILKGAASIAFNLAVSIGKSIVTGALNGISGLASSLKDKVEGAIKGALGHLNPFSPVEHGGEIYIGKPLADGAIMGWINGTRDLPAKMSETLRNALNAAKTRLDSMKGILGSSFSRLGSYAVDAFDAMSAKMLGPKGKLLAQLVSQHDEFQMQKTLTDATQAVADAQKEMQDVHNKEYDSVEEKNAAILDAENNYKDALEQQADARYQIQVAALQKEADAEELQTQSRRELRKQHLQDELNDLEAALMQHPAKYKFYQDQIIALLKSYGITYKASGRALGMGFAQGLRESEADILREARKIANQVAKILKLSSPAEEGPLSDLDTWWTPFARTLLSGFGGSEIQDALLRAVSPGALGGSYALGAAGTGAMGGAPGTPGITNVYYVSGSLVSENDLNNRIRQGINQEASRGRVVNT